MRSWWKVVCVALFCCMFAACGDSGGGGGGGGGGDVTPPTVTATPPGGTYADAQAVTLTANEAATIYYTVDGSAPNTGSTVYTAPIPIAAGVTVRFLAVDTAGNASAVAAAVYAVGSPVAVAGRVVFDDGTPVANAQVSLSVVDEAARAAIRAARQAAYREAARGTGDDGKPQTRRALPRMVLRTLQTVQATTNAAGEFSTDALLSAIFPVRVLAEVSYQADGFPTVTSSRWGNIDQSGSLTLEDITIPDPTVPAREMVVAASGDSVTAESADGTVRVENLPATVARVFGKTFDPGDQSGSSAEETSFPGEFAEMGNIPLNSTAFVWMEAFDAAGNPVDDMGQAVRIRSLVPPAQWPDLEDLTTGTDRIEIPMYVYNEDIEMWEQMDGVGWLEDDEGTVLGEDWQALVLDGSYPGELYAAWTSTHFSWMNVDYPYVGPWTLSRLSRDKRNNDCLYKAGRLAEKIFRTSWANTAYADVNKPGTAENPFNLANEVLDGGGTELKEAALDDATFGQTTSSDFKELLHLNSKLWDNCDTNKKETIFAMAVTILHEAAHWKHDAKKHDGTYADEADVGGEAGLRIEKNLFGESIWTTDGKLPVTGLRTGSGTAITDSMLDDLNDPQWWADNEENFSADFWSQYWASGGTGPNPSGGRGAGRFAAANGESPLQVTLSLAGGSTFDLGAPVPITVTYENIGAETIRVLSHLGLQGYPLSFTVTDVATGAAVPFVGAKIKVGVADTDFVELAPGATYASVVDLTGDSTLGVKYFNFTRSGDYTAQAIYTDYWGLPQTLSDSVQFTLNPGGSLSGRVNDASSGTGVPGARVQVFDGDTEIASVLTAANGDYAVAELPPGTYRVRATARGFVSQIVDNVAVVTSQATTQDFLLTALLTSGQIRIVLTWGASPSDLDSHLWLPPEVPYHLYYSTDGNQLDGDIEPDYFGCPWAMLDLDDTSSYGPETITIIERVRSGEYVYAIRNFSGSPALTASEARVEVFDASGLVATFTVPAEGTGAWWHVMNIDGTTGAITEVNQIVETEPSPYGSTTSGCPEIPQVNFTTSNQTVTEGAGSVTVTMSLSGASEQDVTVPFTVSGSATLGLDFTASQSPLTIPAGQTSADIALTVVEDTEAEGAETIVFTMGVPRDAKPGYTQTHTVTITDND